MVCPKCKSNLIVSSTLQGEEKVMRRRRCLSCGRVLFTVETITDGIQYSDALKLFKKKLRARHDAT